MKRAIMLTVLGSIFMVPSWVFAGIYITAGTDVSTRSYVQFYIQDEFGRQTGQPPTGPEVAEIPETGGYYGTDSIFREDTGESGPESVILQTDSFPAGRFKLVLLPEITTSYWLRVSIVNDNGTKNRQKYFGYATIASPITFEFNHYPSSAAPTPITKIVSIEGLRQSVVAALKLGQLSDPTFASRLDKMLAKAQAEAASGKTKQAANRLEQFVRRLDSAFRKTADPDDGDDEGDKKSAGSMKRFVTKTALDSLSADAKTLIDGLEKKTGK
ncbi:MAG: hypothetical protein AAB036_12230 [Elusimicrobiota bacterium]